MDRIRDGNPTFLFVYQSYLYFPNYGSYFMGECRITFLLEYLAPNSVGDTKAEE